MPDLNSSDYDKRADTLESLAARTREGDSAALAALYSRFSTPLMRLAWRLTGSTPDAEDVLHDVFLGLPEALRHYEERGTFESWIKRLTARVALSRVRSKQSSREQPLDDFPLIQSRDRTDESADAAFIQRAIDSLPELLRVAFVLKVMEGYSHAEIASLLGISRAASEVRLHRATRALRAMLHSYHVNQ